MRLTATTIAGTDPLDGAGFQADLKAIHQHRCFVTNGATLRTAQSIQRVRALEGVTHEMTEVRKPKGLVTLGIRRAEEMGHRRGPLNLHIEVDSQ